MPYFFFSGPLFPHKYPSLTPPEKR